MNAKEMGGVTVHVRLTERMDETQSHAAMLSAPSCIESERHETIESALDRITDRLCLLEQRLSEDENNYGRALALLEDRITRLESPASTETRTGGPRAKLYRCTACNPEDSLPPCACILSQNLGAPVGCIYASGRTAGWKEVDRDLAESVLRAVQE